MCRKLAIHFIASQTRLAMFGIALILGTACGHQDKSQALLPTVAAQSAEDARLASGGAQALMKGSYNYQFLVDWYQGGAGTSTDMNANEALAKRGTRDERA